MNRKNKDNDNNTNRSNHSNAMNQQILSDMMTPEQLSYSQKTVAAATLALTRI